MKFTVSYKLDLRTDVEIEAKTLEEAMKQAKYSYVELGDFNLAEVIETEPVNISDEYGNLLADF